VKFDTLKLEIEGGVAHLTLNRPDDANALNLPMAKDFLDAALHCTTHAEVRAVLLDAVGKMFCAGGDVKSFAALGDRLPAGMKELTTYLHAGISTFSRARQPVVIAVQGAAAGAGMSLAASGDLVLAGESAKFTMAYTGIGVSPDGSSSYFIPRLIGMRRTQELMITNRRLSAAEALEWGLVTQVLPDAELAEGAMGLARSLASGPTRAYGGVKRLLNESFTSTLETQMELEARVFVENTETADGREGIQAFVEKRKPSFQGR
jgi:2-(1,2-epoxy-1,2-dihydrophenyl)acetyl-CoA isomerase